jgi:hypothetical protein
MSTLFVCYPAVGTPQLTPGGVRTSIRNLTLSLLAKTARRPCNRITLVETAMGRRHLDQAWRNNIISATMLRLPFARTASSGRLTTWNGMPTGNVCAVSTAKRVASQALVSFGTLRCLRLSCTLKLFNLSLTCMYRRTDTQSADYSTMRIKANVWAVDASKTNGWAGQLPQSPIQTDAKYDWISYEQGANCQVKTHC